MEWLPEAPALSTWAQLVMSLWKVLCILGSGTKLEKENHWKGVITSKLHLPSLRHNLCLVHHHSLLQAPAAMFIFQAHTFSKLGTEPSAILSQNE